MPIPDSKINRAWIVISQDATMRDLQQRVPRDQRRIQWIVTPISGNEYAVYRVSQFLDFLREELHIEFVTNRLLNAQLQDLGNFLRERTRTAVEQGANWDEIRQTWSERDDPPLVVLQNGTAIGILTSAVRGGASDIDWIDEPPAAEANGEARAGPPTASEQSDEIPAEAPADTEEGEGLPPLTGGGVLGVVDELPPTPAPPPPPIAPSTPPQAEPAAPPPTRFINAVLEDRDPNTPLQVGDWCALAFSVELNKLETAAAAEVFKEKNLFPEGVSQIELSVQLMSDDFTIHSDPQKLIVPKTGKSKNKAKFDIEAIKEGRGVLTAVFIKDGNAVQAIVLTLNVGIVGQPGVLDSQNLGRSLESAAVLQPRDMLWWIDYTGTNYTLRILDKVPQMATLPLTSADLENALTAARDALNAIVNLPGNPKPPYQSMTQIPDAVRDQTLPQLAKAGYLLYQEIFYHAGADDQTRKVGDYIRERALQEKLKIQIISKDMMLPWGLLYVEENLDINHIKPESFLGLKHIIEHVPFQGGTGYSEKINSQPQLSISLNLNQDIDLQMGSPLIQDQIDYWKTKQVSLGINVITRTHGDELIQALANAGTTDQILYFYCHAETKSFNEGGANASQLQFSNGQKVSLSDLKAFAPSRTRLGQLPLIFLNACESAQLSPLFYNGFMPYFVDKGARGMIGTECPVPALFASEWAGKFFDALLAGKPLGDIFLDLRRDYFFNHNNILGLLYAVYCDADTVISPALG